MGGRRRAQAIPDGELARIVGRMDAESLTDGERVAFTLMCRGGSMYETTGSKSDRVSSVSR